MSRQVRGFLAVMVSAVFFGFVPLLVQSVNGGGSNSLNTAFLRFFLSVPVLFLYLKVKKISLTVTRRQVLELLLITVCGYGGTAMLLFASYNYIPSGMATTIHFVYPVFVILGSILFFHEKVRPLKILCVIMCFAGILLFYQSGDGAIQPLGIFLAFCSGVTYSFYIIYLERSSLAEMETMKLIFYMHSIASLMVLAVILPQGKFTLSLSYGAWAGALVLSMGIAFVAVFLFQRGVKLIGAENTAILSTLEPITSLIIGVLVYDEVFGAGGGIGCLLILSSVIIVARMKE